jgi:hypothetical protein
MSRGTIDPDDMRRHALERLEILDALLIALDRREQVMTIVGSAQRHRTQLPPSGRGSADDMGGRDR